MNLPDWLLKHFNKSNFSCPHCQKEFVNQGCVMIGIRIVDDQFTSSKHVLFMEYLCNHCNKRSGFEIIDMELEEFAIQVLQDSEIEEHVVEKTAKYNKDPKKKAKKRIKSESKITSDEQESALEMLNDSRSWSDWLRKIGINPNISEHPDTKDK